MMKKKSIYKKIGYMIGKLCEVPMTKADNYTISTDENNKPKLRGLNNINEFKTCYLDVIKNAIEAKKDSMKTNKQNAQSASSDIYKAIYKIKKKNKVKRKKYKHNKKLDAIKDYIHNPEKYRNELNLDNNATNDSKNDNNNANNNGTAPANNGTTSSDNDFLNMMNDDNTNPNNNQQQ